MKRAMRELLTSDLSLVIEIENRAFTHPWPPEAFVEIPGGRSWILELDGTVRGYILYHTSEDEAVIINFAIDPLYQGQRHGEYLLNSSIRILHSQGFSHFYLDVRKSNENAIKLYNKLGFIPLGMRRNYYSDPCEDAIVMGLVKNSITTGE